MATPHDKQVIERFLQLYNAEFQSAYEVVAWPDDNDRSGKAIDAIAADGQQTLAIEHTLLQPFAGERKDTAVFLQTVGKLDKAQHLIVPGSTVSLSFEVGAVPKGVDWSTVGPAVERWYLAVRDWLSDGKSQHIVPDLPFKLAVNVDKFAIETQKGFFFIDRVMPTQKPLEETVYQALNTKVDKLAAADAAKRFLLLENDIPIYGDGEVGELIEKLLPKFPKMAAIDEVWIVNTSGLTTENYVSIDLIWPLNSAEERDYARNAGA